MNPAARVAVSLLALSLPFPAFAAEQPYIDDRTDAASIVRSLYSAISRKEYARAWDYFGETKPAKDFAAFAKGFENTERVLVATGTASEEGAAGSIFYEIPVAIQATGKDGTEAFFAGCYTARQVNAQIQEPPFRPLHLEKGSLKPAEGPLTGAVPEKCGDAPPPAPGDIMKSRVIKAFAGTYTGICDTLAPDAEDGAADPEVHDLPFRYSFMEASEPDKHATLYRFQCRYGAYNSNEVFYFADDTGDFRQLQFAEPDLDIHYVDPDTETKVESINIIGYTTTDMLVNSEFSPETKTLNTFNKWRGMGDASSMAEYLFRDGNFVLVKYEVDPTTNEEIDPQTVLDLSTAP